MRNEASTAGEAVRRSGRRRVLILFALVAALMPVGAPEAVALDPPEPGLCWIAPPYFQGTCPTDPEPEEPPVPFLFDIELDPQVWWDIPALPEVSVPLHFTVRNNTDRDVFSLWTEVTVESADGHGEAGAWVWEQPRPTDVPFEGMMTPSGPGSVGNGIIDLWGIAEGEVRVVVEVTAFVDGDPDADYWQERTEISESFVGLFTIGEREVEMEVDVDLDPEIVTGADRVQGQPAEVDAAITVTNPSGKDLTHLSLRDLEVSRIYEVEPAVYEFVDPGPVGPEAIAVTSRPDAIDGLPLPDLPAGESMTLRARLSIEGTGAFEVSALVLGARADTLKNVQKQGRKTLTIESGLSIDLEGVDLPLAHLADVKATVKNISGERIDDLDWGRGLDLEVLEGGETLHLSKGPVPALPTSLADGEEVTIWWRHEVANVGVGVSVLSVQGETESGGVVEAVAELSSIVTADQLEQAHMERLLVLHGHDFLESTAERIRGVISDDADAISTDPSTLREAVDLEDQGFGPPGSRALGKSREPQRNYREIAEAYLVSVADGRDRRALEIGDEVIEFYNVLTDADSRSALASHIGEAIRENGGHVWRMMENVAAGDELTWSEIADFWGDRKDDAATAIGEAWVGYGDLRAESDALWQRDPMEWARTTGDRHGATQADIGGVVAAELVSAGTAEIGGAAWRAAKGRVSAGVQALRNSAKAGEGAKSAARAGGNDSLGRAVRDLSVAERRVERFQDLDYGHVLTPHELQELGGFSPSDVSHIQGIVREVKENFGVDLDIVARTAEPLSANVPNGIGKRAYTKEKAVGHMDMLLGAPDEFAGRVTIFEPKPLSPEALRSAESMNPGFTAQYMERLKTQQKNWDSFQNGTSKTGRLVEASKKHDGITIVQELPGNPTHGVEYLEQLSDPSFLAEKGWTPEYASNLRSQLETHPTATRAKLEMVEADGAFSLVDSIDGTARPVISDLDLQAVIPKGGEWPAGRRGQIETFVKAKVDQLPRSGRHGWSSTANDLPSANFDLAAKFMMETAHPDLARETAAVVLRRFRSSAESLRRQAARLPESDPLRAKLLAKAAEFEAMTLEEILKKWPPGEKTIVFSEGRVTVGSGEGGIP